MNTQKILVSVGISLALVLGVVGIARGGVDENSIVGKVVAQLKGFGASVGPESTSDYQCIGNVCTLYRSVAFNTASSTVCTFPITATSTLKYAVGTITTATTTVVQFEWAKGAQMDATTTSLGKFQLIASQKGAMLASSSPFGFIPSVTTDPAYVFGPGTWLVLKYGSGLGSTGTGNGLVGQCKAEFLVN